MARKFWWPGSMPEQVVVMNNFAAKINGYKTALGLATLQVTEIISVCDAFVAAFNAVEQCRQSMQALTQWRDELYYGVSKGAPTDKAPVFPVVPTISTENGLVTEFTKFRDMLLTLPGYTTSIGEDLGIIGSELQKVVEDEVSPVIKSVTAQGFSVQIKGSMQGFDGMRVEYAPKGGSFAPVAFLTNTPATVQISGNAPQTGHVRAVYIRKNQDFGSYSADYPVTLG